MSHADLLPLGWLEPREPNAHKRFRVLDVVAFEEEDESPFVGLLQVEAA